MTGPSYFDKRAATYDEETVHHRVVSALLDGVTIKPGFRVLDVATGTGLLALKAAQCVGPTGKVIGVDLSEGMLAEAHRKAAASELRNIDFLLADAEQAAFPPATFDCIFCASALVLMADIPRALRRWFACLKPGGSLAFDAPAKPFGLSERIADVAADHGVPLAYADVADTPSKCRSLLEEAGFAVVDIRTELADASPIALSKAIAFWEGRLDHPAWRALKRVEPATLKAMRREYVERVTAAAIGGYVANETALNLVFGRKGA